VPHLLPDSDGPHEAEPVDEFAELREELEALREDFEQFRQQVQQDRDSMGRMLHALRAVFGGDLEAATPSSMGGVPQPPNAAAWQMWKDRLPGACPKVIDALLIQPMTATQLIAATRTSYATVQRAVTVLKSNALLDKDGERWRLKRL
jgi:hypothetical protein